MIMAGRHPRAMRPRDESAHPVVQKAIDEGYVGSGSYVEIDGFASRDAANRGRKAVNNAARHLGVSCSSKEAADLLELTDGTWRLRFRLWAKNQGRQHVHQVSGGDPAKLAYNPFARAEGPAVDENGIPFRSV
jgi:hypothetical protein